MAHEDKVDEARRSTLERELEWIRLSPRARQAKGKARINAYEARSLETQIFNLQRHVAREANDWDRRYGRNHHRRH